MAMLLRKSSSKCGYFYLRAVYVSSIPKRDELFGSRGGNGKDRPTAFTAGRSFDLEASPAAGTNSILFGPSFKGLGGGCVRTVASVSASAALEESSLKARGLLEVLQHYGQCYWELSKARLSMLVVATSGAGFVLGSGTSIDLAGLCWTCTGTMMVAASANSFNQIFEVSNDAKMKRTMRRPLPGGRISMPNAMTWAVTMGATGSALLLCKANALAAGLAISNLFLYALIYTPLKQIHPINTWVGAVVGAIPPLIGWVAASGQITLAGLVLPAALYFWQIPHFMALAYLCRNDYVTGGFKMLSLLDVSGARTSLVALRNCIYLLPVGYLAYEWGITSAWFGLETALLTSGMGVTAMLFYLNQNSKNARKLFHASLLYLPIFMAAMLFHRLPNSQFDRSTSDLPKRERINAAFGSVELVDNEESKDRYKLRKQRISNKSRPPVAYASVAPFPFLPVPTFASDE